MKKKALFTSLIAIAMGVIVATPFFANKDASRLAAWDVPQESTEGDYYKSITDGMSGDDLADALASIVPIDKTKRSYDWSRYEAADEYQFDSNSIICVYTRHPILKNSHCGSYAWDKWNREHIWTQSAYPASDTDNHNIFACEGQINNDRGNLPYGEVTHNSSTQCSVHGYALDCYIENGRFEPPDDAKGEIARAVMYGVINYGYNMTNMISYEDALRWNIEHPVSNRDIRRNNVVYDLQKNRNPFVDHPEYACRIWGNKSDDTKQICNVESIAPTSITLNHSELTLTVGETDYLSVSSVTPEDASKAVTYSSSSDDVSITKTGKITANSVGSAVITATSALDSEVTATCSVTVNDKDPVELEDISLSASPAKIKVGGVSEITVTNTPENAYPVPTLTHVNKTPSIIEVDEDGEITGLAVGTGKIEVKAYQDSVLKATKEVSIEVYDSGAYTSSYQEVTSELDDYSGRYLIAYKNGTKATLLDGSATSSYDRAIISDQTITDGVIVNESECYFDIAKTTDGYTIKGSNGRYYGHDSGAGNTLNTSEEPYNVSISFSNNAISVGCDGRVLRYNEGSKLFRFYTGGQLAITLFKAIEEVPVTPTPTEPIDPTETVVPTETIEPTPTEPIEPTETVEPTPTEPIEPTETIEPTPTEPTGTVEPTETTPISPSPSEPIDPTPSETVEPTPTEPTPEPTPVEPTQGGDSKGGDETPTDNPSNPTNEDAKQMPAYAVVLIIVGAVAVVGIIGFLLVKLVSRKRR